MFKKFITFVSFLALVVSIAAQQPQNTLAPIVAENAKYANGVAPGYAPTSGTGLNVNISSGTANCGGTMVTFTGAAESLVANAVNYVYLNTTASCAVSVKTTSFVATDIPVASVTTSSSGIVATCNNNGTASPSGSYPCIIDYRTIFNVPGSGVGSPLTTKGDIYGFNTTNARIPVGADGTVLTAASAQLLGVQWQLPAFLSLTTNGTSGPATLNSGVLNIPSYTGGSGSGVQYNPSTTNYVVVSSSLLMDDNHVLGPTIASTATTCASGICTVTASNTLAVGDWITAAYTTGWPAIASGIYGDGYSEFQVATASGTQFTFAYSGTLTLGAVSYYGANYWPMKLAQNRPFFNGHGTITHFDLGGTCSNAVTNYATYVHPLTTAVTGHPSYVVINDCHNDFAAGTSAATVEGYIQSLASNAHTDGATFVMATPVSSNYGGTCYPCSVQQSLFNDWIGGFTKAYNTVSNQYADIIVPLADALNNNLNTFLLYNNLGDLNPGGSQVVASEYNEFLALQGTHTERPMPWFNWTTDPVVGYPGGLVFRPPQDSNFAFNITNAAETQNYFHVDTSAGIVSLQRLVVGGNSNAFPLQVSTSNTVGGNVFLGLITAPNVAAGSDLWSYYGIDDTNNYNSLETQFHYAASASTSNYAAFQIFGVASPFIRAYGTGEVDLPNQAPASGTACLQVASGTGAITNTGAPCGSGGGGIADTTVAVTTATQTANSCSTTSNVTMTGLTTSMVVHTGYSANPATLTGWGSTGGMVFQIWPSAANTATWQVCNQTASSITYSAITFNVGAN